MCSCNPNVDYTTSSTAVCTPKCTDTNPTSGTPIIGNITAPIKQQPKLITVDSAQINPIANGQKKSIKHKMKSITPVIFFTTNMNGAKPPLM